MKMKQKKTFELSSIKKYKQYERMLWLLLPAFFLLILLDCLGNDEIRCASNFTELIPGILCIALYGAIILFAIPFFVGKILIGTRRKMRIQNCTITSKADFEYYRDKLEGVSPAEISLLTDLEIEQKKDMAASILQCENLGLIEEDADHIYYTTRKYDNCTNLRDSDRYLIEHLLDGTFDRQNDMQWKELATKEAVEDGYITISKWTPPKEKAVSKGKIWSWKIVRILLIIVWWCWLFNAMPRMEACMEVFQQSLEVMSVGELSVWTDGIFAHPGILLGGVEGILLFVFGMYIICHRPGEGKTIPRENKVALIAIVSMMCLVMIAAPFLMAFDEFIDFDKNAASSMALLVGMVHEHPSLMIAGILGVAAFLSIMYMVSYVIAWISPAGTSILKDYFTKKIKRTDYGNQMAECVYGMKNFIHDYSNLSEADRRQVVLWEDYLVYAVVLEENEKIIREIMNTRREAL